MVCDKELAVDLPVGYVDDVPEDVPVPHRHRVHQGVAGDAVADQEHEQDDDKLGRVVYLEEKLFEWSQFIWNCISYPKFRFQLS